MIAERAAEAGHEEIVGERIALGDLPELHSRSVVIAHDEGAGIAISDEAIILAAIDLHLVLIEAMNEVAGRDRDRQVEAVGIVDCEGRIGKMRGSRFDDRGHSALAGQTFPDRRQFRQDTAVAVGLPRHVGCDIGKPVGAGKIAEEIVEAAVLRIDDDESLDFFQVVGTDFGGAKGGRKKRSRKRAGKRRGRDKRGGREKNCGGGKPGVHHDDPDFLRWRDGTAHAFAGIYRARPDDDDGAGGLSSV